MFVLPTLSRPEQCAAVLRRIKDSGCTSKGMVFLNGDSHRQEYYDSVLPHALPDGWGFIFWPKNLGAIGALNKVFDMYPDEPWYGFIADDEMLAEDAPSDWDRRLIEAAGDWKIAHGWEDWNDGRRCQGYPVWGGKLLRAVGYWALPTCWHNFGLDSHWDWLNGAEAFGGGGLRNMVCVTEVEIHHNRAKPDLVLDDCYRAVDEAMEKDRRAFWDWCRTGIHETAKRVVEAMRLDLKCS